MRRLARVVTRAELQAREAQAERTSVVFDYIFGDRDHAGGQPPEILDALEQHWQDIIEMRNYAAEQESPIAVEEVEEARPQRVVAFIKGGGE
eukprot:544637-Prorocentrum_lima.AAC.1